jgi:protein gp37
VADGTKIEWTDATWNVVNGCDLVSPGCTNCYAMRQAHRFPVRRGLTKPSKAGMVWTGEVRFNEKVLLQPISWKRPRKIFVCAHGDLFHEKVSDEWIDKVFAVMLLAPQHVFQVLTKRPERMRSYMTDSSTAACDRRGAALIDIWNRAGTHDGERIFESPWPLPNVWLGTSVEDQKRADERIHILLSTPAAVRWLSCEPLLGPVTLNYLQPGDPPTEIDALNGTHGVLRPHGGKCAKIDWVVAGGESGPGARPMHPDWVVSLQQQCEAAAVPFLFKQWGEYLPDQIGPEDARSLHHPPGHVIYNKVGKKAAGRKLFGVTHEGYPA